MKLAGMAMACVVWGLLAGCEERVTKEQSDRKLDAELVRTLNNVGLENAIIAQHALYPYHFVPNSGTLNQLGERDLAVLARHFRRYPGELTVRQGEASDAMYEARLAQVVSKLAQAQVTAELMTISDGMPGGTGMSSERTVMILTDESEKRAKRSRQTVPESGRITQ